jgi:hypothetical protein
MKLDERSNIYRNSTVDQKKHGNFVAVRPTAYFYKTQFYCVDGTDEVALSIYRASVINETVRFFFERKAIIERHL